MTNGNFFKEWKEYKIIYFPEYIHDILSNTPVVKVECSRMLRLSLNKTCGSPSVKM